MKNIQSDRTGFQIRRINLSDVANIIKHFTFPWSTPEKTNSIWNAYLHEHKEGIRTIAVIECNGKILGYGSLLRKSQYPLFASSNIPEVNAIWIDQNHRRKGLGTALIRWIERLAFEEGYQQIGIGVGLYRDYGPAQRLYFRLGYLPDGNGITYKGNPTIPGESYPLDDDLLLWLIKPLFGTNK